MPFRVSGKNVMVKRGGKWEVKQRCKSEKNAHIALGILKRWQKEHPGESLLLQKALIELELYEALKKRIRITDWYGAPPAARVHPLKPGEEFEVIKFENGGAVIWAKSLVGKRRIWVPSKCYTIVK